jgi:hypothetical protein
VVHVEPFGPATLPEKAIARPRIVDRAIHKARLDGISVDVSHEGVEAAIFLDEEGFVSTLKEMADSIVPAIEPLRV